MDLVGPEEVVDGAGLPCTVESLFVAVPLPREDLAECPALTGEETDSDEGGLFVVGSFLSVAVDEVVVGDFVVFVVVVLAALEAGLLGAVDEAPELRVKALRSAAVAFQSGDLGVVEVEDSFGSTEALLGAEDVLIVASFSAGLAETTFLGPLVVADAPDEITGLVGGLFNPAGAEVIPGGPVRDLSDPVVFVVIEVRLGAAEVVDCAFFFSTIPFSFPVVCPSLSVSCPFTLARA